MNNSKLLIMIFSVMGIITLTTLLTFFLWNWLMPIIFSLPKITLLESFGINVLSGILFKPISYNSKS